MLATYKQLLKEYIAFKSISTDSEYEKDIHATAEWLQKLFENSGFQAKTITGYGNPLVIAEYITDPTKRTILFYGHYDVQPANEKDGWHSDPFSLTERKNTFYARGVADNKGQTLIHIATVLQLIKEKKLGFNVKFLMEGDEETDAGYLPKFLRDHQKQLRADMIMISDGSLVGNSPVLETSFRGSINATLKIKTSMKDGIHSGIYGGAVPVATHEMSKIIHSFIDDKNTILVPGFYEGITFRPAIEVSDEPSTEELKQLTGCSAILLPDGKTYTEQTALLPALVVTGLKSGYIDEGFKNGVPATAEAKINIRSAPEQDSQRLFDLLREHCEKTIPPYVQWTLEQTEPSMGAFVDTTNPVAQEVKIILENVYQKKVVEVHGGGTLPIIHDLQKLFQAPLLLVPLANEDCGMHEVDENFTITAIIQALAFSETFLKQK